MADANISGSATPTSAPTTATTSAAAETATNQEEKTPITPTEIITTAATTITPNTLIERTTIITTKAAGITTENESERRPLSEEAGSSSCDVVDAPSTSASRKDNLTEDMKSQPNPNVRYGKCKWFNVAKGWGFITPNDGGQEVFVHQSVIQMSGFRSLGEQEEVEFEAKETERGQEATRVSGCNGLDCHGSTFRPRGTHNRNSATKKKRRRIRCYNCGEFSNHIAAKCELGPQPKRCHFCKQSDHLYADCPSKKAQSS